MTLRILVPLHTYPDGNADGIARQVAVYAQHLQANVFALACNIDLPSPSSLLGNLVINVPAMIREAKAGSRARSAALIAAMKAELEPSGIPLRTLEVERYPGEFGDVIARQARYHDLVLLGMCQHDRIPRLTAEAVIFGSGRPALLVPESAPAEAPDHVVVAWDGGSAAARAVCDAHPFLHRAGTVTIVTVAGEKPLADDSAGERLAEYLADHDIEAQVSRLQSGGRSIADVLQAHVRDVGAGLLVMGGFGHSRMRDFVLGGATQGILDDLQVPVLVSH
ncbi:universal stress protein [Azospirillum sp. INR13]|uniref:universal stress protein n=1 Tax=Azospirillum sp. INR13 TaxID=2596919 RepID=UPI0018925B0A|nr:universal stress protein [Azospirillum sp. INR13]MBF5094850.1 universal stress protein [Azospirillum sp. INR13]